MDLEDYIDVLRRHVAWIFGPFYFGVVVAIIVAFLLPNEYVSTAQLQITPAQISQNIVASTLNQQLAERIATMQTEILSRTSLSSIIQDPRLDLYKKERLSKPLEDVIETMRARDIRITILSAPGDVMQKRASAFQIQFSYNDAHRAQAVVQTLITKFQEASLTTQREQQSTVTNFFRDGLADAKANLDRAEEELNKFRADNAGKLPEQTDLNISQLTSLQQQAQNINDMLNRFDQQQSVMEIQLEGYQDKLKVYNTFDNEPAAAATVIRRQNERLLYLNKEITDTESALAQMKQIYTPKHPDIRDAERRLEVVRRERDALQKIQDAEDAKPKEAGPKKAPSLEMAQNITALQNQIAQTKASLQQLQKQREQVTKDQQRINAQITNYQERLAATSGLEAKYQDLLRDQKTATEKLQEQQAKNQLAQQNSDLLQRKAGENLEVLDPPSLPEKPTRPNRPIYIGAGAALALVLGLVVAGIHEVKDTSLKNLKDVRAYTNLPVLCSVPLLENTMLVRRKRRLAALAWTVAILFGMASVGAALYYHYTYLL